MSTGDDSADMKNRSRHPNSSVRKTLGTDDSKSGEVNGDRRADQGDGGPLSIADVNAGLVDDDHGSACPLQHNASGDWGWRTITENQRILAAGLKHDVLARWNRWRSRGQDRNLGHQPP